MKLFSVCLLMVALATSAWAEVKTVSGALRLRNDYNTPGIDVYRPKCDAPTTFRARLHLGLTAVNDTLHLAVACVTPGPHFAQGDKEIAKILNNPSQWAETPLCQQVLVAVGCDYNSECVGTYKVEFECTNSTLLPGFGTPTINR